MIGALATAFLFVLAGWRCSRRDASLFGRIGDSYLLGSGLCAATLMLLSLIGLTWNRASFLLAVVCITAFTFLATRRLNRGPRIEDRGLTRGLVPIDILTLVVVVGYARFATIAPSSEADFVGIWGLKARRFFAVGEVDFPWLQHEFNGCVHPDYPLLVPLLHDVQAIISGVWPDRWLGLINVGFGIASLLVVRSMLGEEIEQPWLRSVATLAFVPLLFSPRLGLAEGPFIAFATAGALYVRRGMRDKSTSDVLHGSIHLGLAAMSKNEGIALLAAVVLAMIAVRQARVVLRLWPAAAMVILWMAAIAALGIPRDLFYGEIVARIGERLTQPGEIVAALGEYVVGKPFFWMAIAIVFIWRVRDLTQREQFLALLLALQFLFLLGAYFVTPHDVAWHIRWSWDRLAFQLAPFALFLTVHLLSEELP